MFYLEYGDVWVWKIDDRKQGKWFEQSYIRMLKISWRERVMKDWIMSLLEGMPGKAPSQVHKTDTGRRQLCKLYCWIGDLKTELTGRLPQINPLTEHQFLRIQTFALTQPDTSLLRLYIPEIQVINWQEWSHSICETISDTRSAYFDNSITCLLYTSRCV